MKAPYRVEVKVIKQEGECSFGHRVGDFATFNGEGVEGRICWHSLCSMMYKIHGLLYGAQYPWLDRNVPRKPRLVGGVKGHNIKGHYLAGKPRPVGVELQNKDVARHPCPDIQNPVVYGIRRIKIE